MFCWHNANTRVDSVSIRINNFGVHPNHQNQGIGSQLMEKLIEAAQKLLEPKTPLTLRQTNLGAIRFYERYGFQKSDGPADKEFQEMQRPVNLVLQQAREENDAAKLVIDLGMFKALVQSANPSPNKLITSLDSSTP